VLLNSLFTTRGLAYGVASVISFFLPSYTVGVIKQYYDLSVHIAYVPCPHSSKARPIYLVYNRSSMKPQAGSRIHWPAWPSEVVKMAMKPSPLRSIRPVVIPSICPDSAWKLTELPQTSDSGLVGRGLAANHSPRSRSFMPCDSASLLTPVHFSQFKTWIGPNCSKHWQDFFFNFMADLPPL